MLDTQDGEVKRILLERLNEFPTQEHLAKDLGVNPGLISFVLNDVRPAGPTLLQALGLPIRVHVTLENVDQVQVDAPALAYLIEHYPLAQCCESYCEHSIYKIPPNRKRCPTCAAATPAARRLASDAGICVAEVSTGGRVLAKDVRDHIRDRKEKDRG